MSLQKESPLQAGISTISYCQSCVTQNEIVAVAIGTVPLLKY